LKRLIIFATVIVSVSFLLLYFSLPNSLATQRGQECKLQVVGGVHEAGIEKKMNLNENNFSQKKFF
jgi:hypothetical protein